MEDLNDLPEILVETDNSKKKKEQIMPEEVPEKVEETIEDKLMKSEIINSILMYKVKFEKYLGAYECDILKLKQSSIEELENLLKQIEMSVQCRNSTNMYRFTYGGALETVEKVAPILGMNLNGLAAIMTNNQEIQEILDEISIKYSTKAYTPPEVRLCFFTLYTALSINSQNKRLSAVNKVVEEKVDKKIAEKYADL